MEWEFFSKRRKVSLDTFLKDTPTLDAAKALFVSKGIDLPVDGSLEARYARQQAATAAVRPKTVSAPKVFEPTVPVQVFSEPNGQELVDDVSDDVFPTEDTSNDEDETSAQGGSNTAPSTSAGRRGKSKRRKQ
jgi:hypothetical protein